MLKMYGLKVIYIYIYQMSSIPFSILFPSIDFGIQINSKKKHIEQKRILQEKSKKLPYFLQ